MTDNKIEVMPNRNHIYEHHLVYYMFYMVIMSVWLILASYVLTHYKIDTWTVKQNLALGFLYYLFFAVMIALTPFWYRVILYRFTEKDKYHQSILKKATNQEKYGELSDYLQQNGEIIPNFKQTLYLIGIFWILIFEIYFLFAWIDTHTRTLLWQPEWMRSVSQWVIDHTNTDNKFFDFTFDTPTIPRSETWQEETKRILETPFGHTLATIHIWFMFSYATLIFCMYKIFWYTLDSALERCDPKNIHSVGRFLWVSFVTLFLALPVLLVAIVLLKEIGEYPVIKLSTTSDIGRWFTHLRVYLMLVVFFLFSIKILIGWFQFWKRIFAKLARWLRRTDTCI